MKNKITYLKEGRLAEVIRLIALLGLHDEYSFRTNEGLDSALNGKPTTASTWFDIANEHPEFFKFNVANTSIVLLLRFLNRKIEKGKEKWEPLTIDQAQKLIDQAIALHDKQLARYQRDSFKIPILAAVITAIVSLIVLGINLYITGINNTKTNVEFDNLNKKLDDLSLNVKHIDIKADTLIRKLPTVNPETKPTKSAPKSVPKPHQ